MYHEYCFIRPSRYCGSRHCRPILAHATCICMFDLTHLLCSANCHLTNELVNQLIHSTFYDFNIMKQTNKQNIHTHRFQQSVEQPSVDLTISHYSLKMANTLKMFRLLREIHTHSVILSFWKCACLVRDHAATHLRILHLSNDPAHPFITII